MKLDRQQSALIIIDAQEKLVPALNNASKMVRNIVKLEKAAQMFDVPIIISEQYPAGLGTTVSPLIEQHKIALLVEKRAFSIFYEDAVMQKLMSCLTVSGSRKENAEIQLVFAGCESHVCVLQSVIDALALGFHVFVVTDAVDSRTKQSKSVALKRMEDAGAHLVTTEMVLFEWCETSASEHFRELSKLVQE